jgi:hypothetical protein
VVILIVNNQVVGTVCMGCARRFLKGLISRANVTLFDRGGEVMLFGGGKDSAVDWLDKRINRETVSLVGLS